MPSFLKFKSNVVVPKVVIIAAAVVNAANELGFEVDTLVTSGNDSVHMKGSLHYEDKALDFRTKHLSAKQKSDLVKAVRRRLGRDYTVILESLGKPNEHLHIEYDPK